MTDDPATKDTPPETPEDWAYLWRAARWSHDARPVIGPVVALVKNWKFAVGVVAFVAWLNSPKLFAAIEAAVGLLK